MLVLSRKKNEAIRIGDEIKLVIVEIRFNKVRIGLEAPPHVAIHREEVWLAIRRDRDLPDTEPTPPGMSQPEVE